MQFLSRSLHSLCPALDNELANPFPLPPTGPTCDAQRILSAIFGAPLLIYFPDLVMIIIIVAWGAIFKLTAIPPVLSAWHHPACRGVPAPPLPARAPPSLLLEAIQRALKRHRLICFLVELIQIRCLKTNLVCIVMWRGRASTIDNLLIRACKRAACCSAVNMKWIRFPLVVIQITL